MRYVITGCGQSGTGYLAQMLTAAGLDCGHESVFNSWSPGFDTVPDWQADGNPAGDASFAAAPFLRHLPDDVTVVHLLRPPLDVIRSIEGRGAVSHGRLPWVRFVDAYTDVLEVRPGPKRAAAYWLRWNRLAEQSAHITWDVGNITADDVAALADRAGLDVDHDLIAQALADTPTDVGSGPRAADVGVYHLGHWAEPIQAAAQRYGLPITAHPESPEPEA